MLSFGLLVDAILVVLGLIWCKEIIGRRHEDIAFIRETDDNTGKAVIIGLWIVTALILFALINFGWGLMAGIVGFFGEWFRP